MPVRRSPRTAALATASLLALAACTGGEGATESAAESTDQSAPDHSEQESSVGGPTSPSEDARSTFALDVDTASYDFARRSIADGNLPPTDQIRPEEFVNYFEQDYTEPDGPGFSLTVDGAELPDWYEAGDATHLMRVGLQTRSESDAARDDVNLTFVIDVSGSMSDGDRIGIVKDSLHTLVDRLRPTDAVAIVAYETESHLVQGMTEVGDGDELHSAIDELEVGGSTNMIDGLQDGYGIAAESFDHEKDNRVILLSDGEANLGLTEHDAMLDDLDESIAEGTTLLTVGVGDSYNQGLLEQLADNGDGWAVYFSTATEAERVFSERLTSTLGVAARDGRIQVTFEADTVAEYRLIGFENRAVADEEFTDDSVDGGEVGPGHAVTALYAVSLTGEEGAVAGAEVRWLDPDTAEPGTAAASMTTADFDSTSEALKVDLVAAAFAESLRGGTGFDCADLIPAARDLAEQTGAPDVVELAELIAAAAELGG